MAWTVISKEAGTRCESSCFFKPLTKVKNFISAEESGFDLIAFDGKDQGSTYVPPDLQLNNAAAKYKGQPQSAEMTET
jgi:hypothetical protein